MKYINDTICIYESKVNFVEVTKIDNVRIHKKKTLIVIIADVTTTTDRENGPFTQFKDCEYPMELFL